MRGHWKLPDGVEVVSEAKPHPNAELVGMDEAPVSAIDAPKHVSMPAGTPPLPVLLDSALAWFATNMPDMREAVLQHLMLARRTDVTGLFSKGVISLGLAFFEAGRQHGLKEAEAKRAW